MPSSGLTTSTSAACPACDSSSGRRRRPTDPALCARHGRGSAPRAEKKPTIPYLPVLHYPFAGALDLMCGESLIRSRATAASSPNVTIVYSIVP